MLEQSSIITIISAFATMTGVAVGIKVYSKDTRETLVQFREDVNKSLTDLKQDMKDSVGTLRVEVKEEIHREKKNALELSNQRIGTVEKDVDEIWPRLREAEDTGKKNCFNLMNMQKNCKLHREIAP